MDRMQIYMDAVTRRQLARLAAALRISQSELIREGVQLLLEKKAAKSQDPLLRLSQLSGHSGKHDISEKHDSYLITRKKGNAA